MRHIVKWGIILIQHKLTGGCLGGPSPLQKKNARKNIYIREGGRQRPCDPLVATRVRVSLREIISIQRILKTLKQLDKVERMEPWITGFTSLVHVSVVTGMICSQPYTCTLSLLIKPSSGVWFPWTSLRMLSNILNYSIYMLSFKYI